MFHINDFKRPQRQMAYVINNFSMIDSTDSHVY